MALDSYYRASSRPRLRIFNNTEQQLVLLNFFKKSGYNGLIAEQIRYRIYLVTSRVSFRSRQFFRSIMSWKSAKRTTIYFRFVSL